MEPIEQFLNQVHTAEALTFLQSLPPNSLDALVTDPPYSSGGQFRGDRMQATNTKYTNGDVVNVREDFAGDNRDQRAFTLWCSFWIAAALPALKVGSPIVLFTDWRQLPAVTDALQCGGALWRGIAVWDKTEAARPTLGRFKNQCEYIVWGSAGPMPTDRLDDTGQRCLPGVFRTVVKQADKHHVTGKPTDLMRQVVKICRTGGTILDPFCGSGSTLVAAKLEGYNYIGCDIMPHYADVSRKRLGDISQAVGTTATLF